MPIGAADSFSDRGNVDVLNLSDESFIFRKFGQQAKAHPTRWPYRLQRITIITKNVALFFLGVVA